MDFILSHPGFWVTALDGHHGAKSTTGFSSFFGSFMTSRPVGVPSHDLVAGGGLGHRGRRVGGRAAVLAEELPGPGLTRRFVGLSEEAIEVLRGLGEAAARVVKLPAEGEDQSGSRFSILEQGPDPPSHGRPVGATSHLVGNAGGVGIGEDRHGE